jgi:hypothetical protein
MVESFLLETVRHISSYIESKNKKAEPKLTLPI